MRTGWKILLMASLVIPLTVSEAIIPGGEAVRPVEQSDSLPPAVLRSGMDTSAVATEPFRGISELLLSGGEFRVNTRKIPPKTLENGIIVDIPGRMLYHFQAGKLKQSFAVGLGMPQWRGNQQFRTPASTFTIIGKKKDPVWIVPDSIQWRMQVEGKPVITRVPPGPDNPLGRFALYTSVPGIIIHGTIAPRTVSQFMSHGCIRMLPQDIEELYKDIDVGTPGELVYDPVKVALADDGKVFLEVNPDVYGKVKDTLGEIMRRMDELQVADKVDWTRITTIADEQSGIAEDVALFNVSFALSLAAKHAAREEEKGRAFSSAVFCLLTLC